MTDPTVEERAQLERLGQTFLSALEAKDAGHLDRAEDLLRSVIKVEPRLAEPHMELARILLDTDRLDAAEAEAREALEQLAASGPWTEDLPENVLHGIAHALLAEILRRKADEDDVIFGDPEAFTALVAESREHFDLAARLDPSDEYASYHAFFLGTGADGDEEADPS